jgi:hypothetical protein
LQQELRGGSTGWAGADSVDCPRSMCAEKLRRMKEMEDSIAQVASIFLLERHFWGAYHEKPLDLNN